MTIKVEKQGLLSRLLGRKDNGYIKFNPESIVSLLSRPKRKTTRYIHYKLVVPERRFYYVSIW